VAPQLARAAPKQWLIQKHPVGCLPVEWLRDAAHPLKGQPNVDRAVAAVGDALDTSAGAAPHACGGDFAASTGKACETQCALVHPLG
jgi:hypothetical protein